MVVAYAGLAGFSLRHWHQGAGCPKAQICVLLPASAPKLPNAPLGGQSSALGSDFVWKNSAIFPLVFLDIRGIKSLTGPVYLFHQGKGQKIMTCKPPPVIPNPVILI